MSRPMIVSHLMFYPILVPILICNLLGYSIPLASTLSLQLVTAEIFANTDRSILNFFTRARVSIVKASILFSLSILVVFIPSVFFLIPNSQKNIKNVFLEIAKRQLEFCEPLCMHHPFPGLSFWFESKKIIPQKKSIALTHIMLHVTQVNNISVLCCAEYALLNEKSLQLFSGSYQCYNPESLPGVLTARGTFKEGLFFFEPIFSFFCPDLVALLGGSKQDPTRSADLAQLWLQKKHGDAESAESSELVILEYHKKIIAIAWCFLLPIIGYFLMFIWGLSMGKPPLFAIISSALLFFISYSHQLTLTLFKQLTMATCIVFYGPILFFGLCSFFMYLFTHR